MPAAADEPIGQGTAHAQDANHTPIPPDLFNSFKQSDEQYNADGTYFFPPYPRSAAQVLAFWARVKVPDELLSDIQSGYRTMQATPADNAEHIYRRFPLEWLTGLSGRQQRETWDRRRQHRAAAMPDEVVRPIARLANAYWQAERLSIAEADKVRSYPVMLPNGHQTTARKVVEDYDFDIYRWCFRGDDQPEWW